MKKEDKGSSLRRARSLMKDRGLTEALAGMIEKQRGDLGFLLRTLKRRPGIFNAHVLKGSSLFREPSALDRKTAELVAVGAATALRCEHCIEAHINSALAEGASLEEVLDALLISGAIAESSTLSVALRKFIQQEGKASKKQKENARAR
ncbi:MAG: carboxymuconolactone decarboxylase family protein [Nitrospirae bacterium]|nr:carboxymuconolactone decarboxylase family protein [Nitrospirota bacterium]